MKQSLPKVFKIKPEKFSTWQAWCNRLNAELYKEAQATLRQEGLLFEYFINFEINDEYFTLGAGISDHLKIKNSDMLRAINVQHKKVMQECLELLGEAEYAYFISVKERRCSYC